MLDVHVRRMSQFVSAQMSNPFRKKRTISTRSSVATDGSTTTETQLSVGTSSSAQPSSAGRISADTLWAPSRAQQHILKSSWSTDTMFLCQFGHDVYDYVFERDQELLKLFRALNGKGETWRTNLEFQNQSLAFSNAVGTTIGNLYRFEWACEFLEKLGAAHRKFVKVGLATEKRWKLFQAGIEWSISRRITCEHFPDLTGNKRTIVLEQWTLLASFIIRHLYIGYTGRKPAR